LNLARLFGFPRRNPAPPPAPVHRPTRRERSLPGWKFLVPLSDGDGGTIYHGGEVWGLTKSEARAAVKGLIGIRGRLPVGTRMSRIAGNGLVNVTGLTIRRGLACDRP
jgi:hypothetical protein